VHVYSCGVSARVSGRVPDAAADAACKRVLQILRVGLNFVVAFARIPVARFLWLDYSKNDRRKMLDVVNAFALSFPPQFGPSRSTTSMARKRMSTGFR